MTRFRSVPAELEDAAGMAFHISSSRVVAASPERCFAVLADGENQAGWASGYRSTVWHTPPGPGAVRDIRLRWITVTERFLAWEPGRRFAFSSDAMTLPLVRQMIEDISFTPHADGTLLEWTVHLTPRRWLRPVERVLVARVFTPMFEGFAAGLAGQAESGVHAPR